MCLPFNEFCKEHHPKDNFLEKKCLRAVPGQVYRSVVWCEFGRLKVGLGWMIGAADCKVASGRGTRLRPNHTHRRTGAASGLGLLIASADNGATQHAILHCDDTRISCPHRPHVGQGATH